MARAGRQGTAYSILIHNEMPYLLDLYLFLGSKLTFTPNTSLDKVSWFEEMLARDSPNTARVNLKC